MDRIPSGAARLLRGLSLDQRRQVTRAVRRGEAVADPSLAPVAVALAERQQWLLGRSGSRRAVRRVGQILLISLAVVAAIAAAATGRYVPSVVLASCAALFTGLLLAVPRIEHRAAEAEQRNRAIQDARDARGPSPGA